MTSEKKIYRTAAFKVPKDGEDHVIFWTLMPYHWDDKLAFVTEHDLYAKGSTSKPVTKELPLKEALAVIEEIERGAAGKYFPADESYKQHRWIGETYRDAPMIIDHPLREAERKEKVLKDLKARKPPGLSLKP